MLRVPVSSRLSGTARSLPVHKLARPISTRWFAQTAIARKRAELNGQDEGAQSNKRRTSPGKNSLRRVSIEAERSRLVINKAGRKFIDPDADTQDMWSDCYGTNADMSQTVCCLLRRRAIRYQDASRLLKKDGFKMDPLSTGLFPQVVHVQTPITPDQDRGDVFIFPSGTVVAWNVPDKTALRLVQQIPPPLPVNSHSGYVEVEKEDLEYIEDSTKDRSEIVGDTIVIGTQASKVESAERSQETDGPSRAAEVDLAILAKIAFSSGLARSTKLAVLERLTDAYFSFTVDPPHLVSRQCSAPDEAEGAAPHLRDAGVRVTAAVQQELHSAQDGRAAEHPGAAQPV